MAMTDAMTDKDAIGRDQNLQDRTERGPDPDALRFLRLGTDTLDAISAGLGPRCRTVPVRPLAGLVRLLRRRGIVAMLRELGRAAFRPEEEDREAVWLNICRRAIRLPWLFDHGPVLAAYGAFKRIEARLLREVVAEPLEAASASGTPAVSLVFNGSKYPEIVLAQEARKRALPRLFIENGHLPGTFQMDPCGINADACLPRDPAFYRSIAPRYGEAELPREVGERAAKLRHGDSAKLPERFIFVPFQVPSDVQVLRHSPWIRDMEHFHTELVAAADRNPQVTFVIKEHPSWKRPIAGKVPAHSRVIFANAARTPELIRRAEAIVTINSTVGLEALVMNRKVIVLGEAIYHLPGLVLEAEDAPSLDAALASLEGFSPDPELRRGFLGYLANEFLVPGSWREWHPDFPRHAAAKIAGCWPRQD